MIMNPTELNQTLETLHAELNSASSVDDQTRAKLVALAEDIKRLAAQDGDEAAEFGPLSERVHDLVLKFETDHPKLTTALNQVSAALANLGI